VAAWGGQLCPAVSVVLYVLLGEEEKEERERRKGRKNVEFFQT
jgi:hypothetical protein